MLDFISSRMVSSKVIKRLMVKESLSVWVIYLSKLFQHYILSRLFTINEDGKCEQSEESFFCSHESFKESYKKLMY